MAGGRNWSFIWRGAFELSMLDVGLTRYFRGDFHGRTFKKQWINLFARHTNQQKIVELLMCARSRFVHIRKRICIKFHCCFYFWLKNKKKIKLVLSRKFTNLCCSKNLAFRLVINESTRILWFFLFIMTIFIRRFCLLKRFERMSWRDSSHWLIFVIYSTHVI